MPGLSSRSGKPRKLDHEHATSARNVLHGKRAAIGFDAPAADREPEPGSVHAPLFDAQLGELPARFSFARDGLAVRVAKRVGELVEEERNPLLELVFGRGRRRSRTNFLSRPREDGVTLGRQEGAKHPNSVRSIPAGGRRDRATSLARLTLEPVRGSAPAVRNSAPCNRAC
jgi:hypothetical protein